MSAPLEPPPEPPLSPFDRFSPGVARQAPAEGPERSKRWRVLGYAAAAAFALSMFVGTAVLLGVSRQASKQEPLAVVKAQIADVSEGRLDAAYARLSETWRGRLTREQFAEVIRAHPGLGHNAHHSFRDSSLEGDNARFEGTLVSDEGDREDVTIDLVRERGSWAIAAIQFVRRR